MNNAGGELRIGCHLSVADGYAAMGEKIFALGGNTFQYFTKNPRGAVRKQPDPADAEALRRLLEERRAGMPVAHAPYTYNPSAAREDVRTYTKESMAEELRFLEILPGSLYNFHPGCHVGQGTEEGIRLIAELLDEVLWPGMHTAVLLETMAGKGTEIGRTFEELAAVIARVDPGLRDSLGVCLDTCHVSDAGYPVREDFDGVLREFDRTIGIDRLRAVHLNDSKNPEGSRKDRHEKLGEGTIGLDALLGVVSHPMLKGLPICLETPNDEAGYAREIALIRERTSESL